MIVKKPKLLPVSVPWMISASVPYLAVQVNPAGVPVSATFIGYFKCDDAPGQGQLGDMPQVIYSAPEFEPRPLSEKAPFRMVKVSFVGGKLQRMLPSYADSEVVREDDYDWSATEDGLRLDETIEQNLSRVGALWLSTGICPGPRMYDVLYSPWLKEENLLPTDGWHHYLLLGHDEYVEVIAKGWKWEPGQPA